MNPMNVLMCAVAEAICDYDKSTDHTRHSITETDCIRCKLAAVLPLGLRPAPWPSRHTLTPYSEVAIYEAQKREDARALRAGETPRLITAMADIR